MSFFAVFTAALALACSASRAPMHRAHGVEASVPPASETTGAVERQGVIESADIPSKAPEEATSKQSEADPGQGVDAGAEIVVEAPAERLAPKKSARGSLKKEIVADVVRAGYPPLLDCISNAVQPGHVTPLLTTVKFTISPKGAIQKYAVVDGGSGNRAVDRCTLDAVRKLKFPPPEGNGPVEVLYPYRFHFVKTGESPKTEPAPSR
jgi:TonB family protein